MTQTATHLSLVPVSGDVLDAPPALVTEPTVAEALTARAHDALTYGITALVECWDREVWRPLGYVSWDAYLEARFGDLRHLRLPAGPRRERLVAMRRAGMSVRQICAAPGMGSKSTVGDDVQALRESGVDLAEGDGIRGADGITRPATRTLPEPPPAVWTQPMSRVATVLRLVSEAGAAGLTVTTLKAATGWGHQEASPALSRLAGTGRLVYRAGEKRGRVGTYVLPE